MTDPRVVKMGRKLCNANALQGVTLVLGALAQLWMLADTHIGNDDVLPLGTNDINELIGLENFCEILPSDWLQVLDPENVKLPGFHTHNGTQAKKKAQTAKRVSKHRIQRNARALQHVTQAALPDQDQDQDQDHIRNPLPLGLDLQAWGAWNTYRTKIRKPLKAISLSAAKTALAKYGGDQSAVVEQSIANGWTGLFPLKTLNGKADKPYAATRSAAEILAEEEREQQSSYRIQGIA